MTEKALLLHARLNAFQRLVDRTRDVIREGLSQCERPYVACSFGKDSAAMLHLVLDERPRVPVRFMRWTGESELLHDYGRVAGEWEERFAIELSVCDMSRSHLDEKHPERWEAFGAGADAYFVGFRAEESAGRRITLRKDGLIYRRADGMLRIAPLAWWTVRDVAAYCVLHDLPMLDAYRSEGWDARTTARVPRADRGIRSASLASLKRRDPAAFNALLKRFPEAAFYV